MLKNEEIKIRVPAAMKSALKALADERLTSESELAREALIAYLGARGITPDMLREKQLTSADQQAANDKAAAAVTRISYTDKKKKGAKL